MRIIGRKVLSCFYHAAAQNGQPTRPQGVRRLRHTLFGMSQGDGQVGGLFQQLSGFHDDVHEGGQRIRPLLVGDTKLEPEEPLLGYLRSHERGPWHVDVQ